MRKGKEEGKHTTVAWSLTRPDRAYLYADDTDRPPVFYKRGWAGTGQKKI